MGGLVLLLVFAFNLFFHVVAPTTWEPEWQLQQGPLNVTCATLPATGPSDFRVRADVPLPAGVSSDDFEDGFMLTFEQRRDGAAPEPAGAARCIEWTGTRDMRCHGAVAVEPDLRHPGELCVTLPDGVTPTLEGAEWRDPAFGANLPPFPPILALVCAIGVLFLAGLSGSRKRGMVALLLAAGVALVVAFPYLGLPIDHRTASAAYAFFEGFGWSGWPIVRGAYVFAVLLVLAPSGENTEKYALWVALPLLPLLWLAAIVHGAG